MALGMPLREAQARWPTEPLLPLDRAAAEQAFEPVLKLLDTFSPFVEEAVPGLAYLDASGLERRYGPPTALGRAVRAAVAKATGFEPVLGIAAGKFLAEVAARSAGASGVRVVPPGDAAESLARLPVAALGMGPTAVRRLRALGVRSVKQFAALPANSILHRYGADGWRAYRGLHGRLRDPLVARRHPLVVHDLLDFEWVEDNPDRLLFAAKMLVDRLADRLARHRVATRTLRVRWTFEDGARQDRDLRLAEPTARAGTLLRYLRWHLDGLQVAQGITGIRLRADELTDTSGWQLRLLAGPDGRVPDLERRRRALDVLGRIRARWGDRAVRQVELTDARRPERGFRSVEATLPELVDEPASAPRTQLPFWLLDPPRRVRVVDERADRRIVVIDGHGHVVTAQAGPWRLHDTPWRDDTVARDYYQFQAATGNAFLCFHDRHSAQWYLQGLHD